MEVNLPKEIAALQRMTAKQLNRKFAHKQARTDGDLAAAFSKLEGYAARLALLHHVCQSVAAEGGALEPVTLESIRAGIALAEWFTYEAERVNQMLGEETQEVETRRLVEVVNRLAEEHGRVTAKQLQRANQRLYRTAEVATAALESLVELGLGRWETSVSGSSGGRPSRFFIPCVTCDETDETSEDWRFDEDDSSDETSPGGGGDCAASACPESTQAEAADDTTEVSSVSSHVTHDSDSPLHPPGVSRGFVTHEPGVSSHTSLGFRHTYWCPI